MNIIRVLKETLASQIAAGEVIERPASVARELIDNSIDAGADRVTVKIEKGGKRLIKVSDNGAGMSRNDLLLCLERHATSKIYEVQDLSSIRTLGFRGEAIPSIASVSRMEITSRPKDQLAGHRLRVEGGKLKSIEETGSPAGTIVEAGDLFFNIPARRKFLRTAKTETDHIVETLSRIALPFADIHFRLNDGMKTLLNLPSSENLMNRLTALMGRHIVSSMIEAFNEDDEFQVKAYLGSPDQSRAKGDHIFIYVNNRNIRDRVLLRAIMEGYGQRLMKGRYPQLAVFINVDPSQVDVNVHPTKQEIRFHQGHLVYRALSSTINGALGEHFRSIFDMGDPKVSASEREQKERMFLAEPESTYAGALTEKPAPRKEGFGDHLIPEERAQVLGQLKGTYILCQVRDGLVIFDQHAAHERVVYETLKNSFRNSNLESQAFLIPYKFELSLKESQVLLKKQDHLLSLGLEIDHFGGNTFLLRSVPTILVNVKWESFLGELIPMIEKEGDLTQARILDGLLTLMACHGAIRAGQRLTRGEMDLLLEQLEGMDLPTHCPHGRPILKKFNDYALEKMFKRVV